MSEIFLQGLIFCVIVMHAYRRFEGKRQFIKYLREAFVLANNLVIVESPTKVKSVKKFLGPSYTVLASNGHVRDLPKSSLGIDVEHDFEPKYITIRGKGELVASLKKAASKADKVYLATDPDREGEAISWHLSKALKLDPKKMRRITFNEITKSAVKASLKNARDIDMNLVNEQQARRCLDRMVGYEISPLLWKKIKRGLSAGRVQSVALRIIADREDEINSFIPKEYWTLDADLQVDGMKKPLTAHFYGKDGKKAELQSEEQVRQVLSDLQGESFHVEELKKGERTRKAPLPFTTSTLQQEASRTLNMSTYKTMQVAQQLYEGITLPREGTVGLISYLRTDSTRISEEADQAARSYIAGCARGHPPYGYYKNTGICKGASYQRTVPSLSADLEAFYGQPYDAGPL